MFFGVGWMGVPNIWVRRLKVLGSDQPSLAKVLEQRTTFTATEDP